LSEAAQLWLLSQRPTLVRAQVRAIARLFTLASIKNLYKARLSVRGEHLLYEDDPSRSIPHKKLVSGLVAKNKIQAQNFISCKKRV
jgi:hypothetical protein